MAKVRRTGHMGWASRPDNSAEARFGKHVTPQPNGCWAWKGDLTKYGKFDVGRVQTPAHRFAFEVMVGPIPDGHHIHHACKNPGVNPEHLVSVSPEGAPVGPHTRPHPRLTPKGAGCSRSGAR